MKAGIRAFFIAAFLLSGACTEKGKPIHTHEADRRGETQQTATEVTANTLPQAMAADINELAARVLNPKRILDPASASSRQVQDELIALNDLLIRSKAEERKSESFTRILKSYVTGLQLECGEIKSSCAGLRYFRMASNSSEVAKMAAQRPEFAALSERLLFFAVEMKNSRPDHELLQLLVSKVKPGNAVLQSVLNASLLLAAQNLRDEAALRGFLGAIKAWELAGNEKWMLSSAAQSALWSMISRAGFMYGTDGKLSPEFQAQIRQFHSRPDSLASLQKSLVSRRLFKPEAMGVKLVANFDELYFIIDAVFLQKLAGQSAAELFQSTGRKPEELAAAVENYVRMRFALAVYDSTVLAQKIFTAVIPTEQLLVHALRQSSQVQQIWGTLDGRLNTVKGFATSVLQQTAAGEKLEPALRANFNSFGRSVNLVSTYPHTLLLFHMLSQKRFKLYLRGMGELDSGDLMPMIFHGSMPPLLDYSSETTALNHFEILHAFDMAVRSQLFTTVGIDVDTFMSDTLSRLNQNPMLYIENTLNRIEQRFVETKLFREFRGVCQEFKTGQKIPRVLDLPGIRRSPVYGGMLDKLFNAMSSEGGTFDGQAGSLTEKELGLFYLDHGYAEALEKVRLDLQMFERVGQSMLTSYSDYLSRFENLSQAEIAKKTAKTRAVLESMRKLKDRTLSTAKTWHDDIGTCYFKVAKRDYDSFHVYLKLEEQHLAKVHRDLKRLRDPQITENEKQQIVESHQFKGLPSGFKGLNKLDNVGYTYSSIDFLLRTARNIEKVTPHITINYGSKLDLDVDMVREARLVHLPFIESEEAFVRSGLQSIFPQRDPFAVWLSLAGGRIINWNNYMKSLVSSYRLENEVNGTAKVFTPKLILEAHEEVAQLTLLNEDDRRLFHTLRMDSRFDIMYLNNSLLSYTADIDKGKFVYQDLWQIFDMPVYLMNYEKLGYDYDLAHMGQEKPPKSWLPKRFGYMELGRFYYNSRSSWIRGRPIIPYSPALDRVLDNKVTKTVRTETKAIKDFHQATAKYVEAIRQRPARLQPIADVDIDTRITGLLNDSLIPGYNAGLQEFRQTTQHCYDLKCSDFN